MSSPFPQLPPPLPQYAYISDISPNNSRRPIIYKYNPKTDCIGEGGFGTVYKVTKDSSTSFSPSTLTYALKCIKKQNIINTYEGEHQVREEIRIHRQLKHENICKFEHSFEDKSNIYILLEYCHDYSLHDYLRKRKRLKEIEVRFFMFQVLKAMLYLLRYKIVHKDLTLSNIFLTNNKQLVKIGDFGLSYQEKGEHKQGYICGTNGYLPPEAIYNTIAYTSAIDVYAFGICIYVLLTGKKLFKKNNSNVYEKIEERKVPYDKYTFFSKEVKDLMDRIFTLEKERIDFYDIYQHPFFNKGIGLDIKLPILNVKGIKDEKEVEMVKRKFELEVKRLGLKVPMGIMRCSVGKGIGKCNKSGNGNGSGSGGKMKIKFENKQKVVLYNTEQHGVAPLVYDTHVIMEETEVNVDDIENPEIKINSNNNSNNSNSNSNSSSSKTNSECECDDISPNTQRNMNINMNECNDEDTVLAVNNINSSTCTTTSTIYIKYFKDYSNEYGLLYVLSNGIRCFLFNDTSLLLLYITTTNQSEPHFFYNTYNHKTHTLLTSIHFTSISSLEHTNHLTLNTLQLTFAITHLTSLPHSLPSPHHTFFPEVPHITKWKHTPYNTYIFILSTNVIECYCNDNTIITFHNDISSSLKYINYHTTCNDVITIKCDKTFTSFTYADMNITLKIHNVIKEILNS